MVGEIVAGNFLEAFEEFLDGVVDLIWLFQGHAMGGPLYYDGLGPGDLVGQVFCVSHRSLRILGSTDKEGG